MRNNVQGAWAARRGLFGMYVTARGTSMKLQDTVTLLRNNEQFHTLAAELAAGGRVTVAVGASARAYVVAGLHQSLDRPVLVLTAGIERANRLAHDVRAFSADAELLPEVETMLYDSLSPSAASVGGRFAVLDRMAKGASRIWVSSVQAAMRVMAPPAAGLHRPLHLAVGDTTELYGLAADLVAMGYVRVALVEQPGEFSLRGGLIDIYPSDALAPVRIELFGDEVDSIRTFATANQRSVERIGEVAIYGCRQVSLTQENIERALERLPHAYSSQFEDEVGRIKDGMYFEGVEKYLPFLYEETASLIDYLPPGCIVIVDEPEETEQAARRYFEQQQSYTEHLVAHQVLARPPESYFKEPAELLAREGAHADLISIGEAPAGTVCFGASPVQPMVGRVEQLRDVLQHYRKQGLAVVLCLPDEAQRERVTKLCDDWQLPCTGDAIAGGRIGLAIGTLTSGFVSSDIGLALISFGDIFGRHSAPAKAPRTERGRAISDITELKAGDYVVHSAHGIAVYGGLQRREVAGIVRDYAVLEYAGTDRLFVPTDQLDRITRYIGAAGEAPTISRLGSAEWLRAKRKAKASVRKVAYDLLALYAERAKARGFAFSADSPWQKEMEDAFTHEETPDQLGAIEEVKADMERDAPMDRLICGDVGYGKTEVAVRAAFKAAIDGKQVLVLVPTTILAQQHYTTFSERLAAFPVTIEMVSRFKSKAAQREIISRFNEGGVDILIGTHRLLQSDVKPFNLGLVIIDEEQRFGVNDKEKIRSYRKSVDVLALSATPIPRTLQMSLAGVRDMSVIETPPAGRHPIVTHVGRYDEEMMVQAIRRELGRSGQVYYVHNRVETISRIANRIAELVPEARVAVAHGQMSEHQLEKVMLAFLRGDNDVLVCTTIIESGIDIPSVNTLIVDRAEHLGLAQLYQLRGRVGRSGRRAYAYFFFSPQRLLTTQAFERLKTISDFTELGSGIKVAMRDLEIRGAGNLLGAEQSGHMSAVGFDLYCQMLREAIEEFEGRPALEPDEIKIDLPVNAYLPESYIAEESLRIEAYKRIILTREAGGVDQVLEELVDRYGPAPEPVVALIGIAKLRLLARGLGITEIGHQRGRVRISPIRLDNQQVAVLARSYKNLQFRTERAYALVTGVDSAEIIAFLLRLFNDIMSALSVRVAMCQKAR